MNISNIWLLQTFTKDWPRPEYSKTLEGIDQKQDTFTMLNFHI